MEGVLATFTTGLLTGLALIAAVGAQAAFVLRQGIRREYIGTVVMLCIASDVLLIGVGVAGVGAFISSNEGLLTAMKYGGALYLVAYAYGSFRSALRSTGGINAANVSESGRSRMAVVAATLAITFLNPHVYLDTVLMLGNLANQYPGAGRWEFGAGALGASVIWFLGLGFGAKRLAPYLAKQSVWRGVDAAVGVLMLGIASTLVFG